jgi:polyhydroxyalkanoate synthesis repressor PhaR
MTAETIRIRRYPNRRFYDRTRRRYVTLDDIEELVRQGQTVEVHDSRTGEDLTRNVLTQILLERHPDKMALFPSALLHGLLRANDLATEFWRAYLRNALAALEGFQRSITPMGLGFPWLPPNLLPGWPPAHPSPPASEPAEALAARLAALEERIGRLENDRGPDPDGTPDTDADALDRLEQRVRGLEGRHDR